MTRWVDDKLGQVLVGVPLVCSVVSAVGLTQRSNAGVVTFAIAALSMIFVTYVVAGMDATRRGQSASIFILFAWGIGYPLHMRSRQRYTGNYFGVGSGVIVMACWLVFPYIAVLVTNSR